VKTNLENNKRKQREQKQLVRNRKTIETMKTRRNQLIVVALFALLMFGGNVSAKGTELDVSSLENFKEPALSIEDWMIDADYWSTTNATIDMNNATEESLELENWMIDKSFWKQDHRHFKHSEKEKALALEPWMIDEKVWNNK